MSLKELLNTVLTRHEFAWIEVVNNEGLSIAEAGAEELQELAARLPPFLESGDRIARAAQLGHDMGFILLVPKKGVQALLMRTFEVRDQSFTLVAGTEKLPSKPKQTLESICQDISGYL